MQCDPHAEASAYRAPAQGSRVEALGNMPEGSLAKFRDYAVTFLVCPTEPRFCDLHVAQGFILIRNLYLTLARVQLSNAEPGQLRCFIFYVLSVGSGGRAYSAFGSCAMILKPVASQNIDDRSAQGHLPIRVVVIVKYHVFLACQHIKYGVDAMALFVHGDD
jgi:hypothetical protein